MPLSDGDTANGAYSRADRLLHRIALGSAPVLEMSFDIERSRFGRAAGERAGGGAPVFVAGLARAGTTIVTRMLHDSGHFASLTYRDMPFPLAPNSWHGMTRNMKRQVERRERGHGDGIEHDLDSPEAIEEVFWRAFEGKRYVTRRFVHPHEPMPATVAAFRELVALVRHRYDRPRYLSKNNANVLRLGGIVAAFPDAVLIHPFRDPVQQAASLLAQHRRANDLGRSDPFRARFMTWLGHHEFGRDHRPALIPGAPAPTEPSDRIDYWLKIWTSTHRRLLAEPPEVRARQRFVDYDRLCAAPAAGLAAIAGLAGIEAGTTGDTLRAPKPHQVEQIDQALVTEAYAVHAALAAAAGA
jgi:hypothetical protein